MKGKVIIMTTENIFKYAMANHLTFPSRKGQKITEELFDFSIEELDAIYKTLNRQMKDAEEDSLLAKRTKDDDILAVKIAIIKEIVADKQNRIIANQTAKEKAEHNQAIMEIIARKKQANLENMTIEELEAMIQ